MSREEDKNLQNFFEFGPENDISDLLAAWPYDEENEVRRIRGLDGREKLQVRTPLGIEQYELDGRPDGLRPEGYESYLDYYEDFASRSGPGWFLSKEDFKKLQDEGLLYYQRYLLFFKIGEYELCARDTKRNLRLLDFVKRYTSDPELFESLEQYRPYIIRMRTMAEAVKLAREGRLIEAVEVIDSGLEEIEELEPVDTPVWRLEKTRSLISLRDLKNQLGHHDPVKQIERLKEELQEAVSREDYETAAALRDEINKLKRSYGNEKSKS